MGRSLFLISFVNWCNNFNDLEIAPLRYIWEIQWIFYLSQGKISNIQREASPLDTEKQLFVAIYVTGLCRGVWERGGWEGFPPDQNKAVNHQCHTVGKMCKTILRCMARLLWRAWAAILQHWWLLWAHSDSWHHTSKCLCISWAQPGRMVPTEVSGRENKMCEKRQRVLPKLEKMTLLEEEDVMQSATHKRPLQKVWDFFSSYFCWGKEM